MNDMVVIGGSRGLGAHIANRSLREGWQVAAIARSPRDDTDLDPGVDYVQADLADDSSIGIVGELLEKIQPAVIVHNAVRYPADGGPGDIDAVFRVNATIPYRILLPYLTQVPAGEPCSCIVINSDSIYHASPGSGIYAASKAALRVLTSTLAGHCRSSGASVSTLLLGALADPRKLGELDRIAQRRGVTRAELEQAFLRRSNPSTVIGTLLPFDAGYDALTSIVRLGRSAHGMVCRLDGGSAGSLI